MDFVTILPLLLIGVVFYLLVLRPQKARQKAQAAMIAAVAPGSSSWALFGAGANDSGGEGNVVAATLFPPPAPATAACGPSASTRAWASLRA